MLLFLQRLQLGCIQKSSNVSIMKGIRKPEHLLNASISFFLIMICKNRFMLSKKNDEKNDYNIAQIIRKKHEIEIFNKMSNFFMLLFLILTNIYLSNYYVLVQF